MEKDYEAILASHLERLEDSTLSTNLVRRKSYQAINNALIANNDADFGSKYIQKILDICLHDLNEDRQYSSYALSLITVILEKVKKGLSGPQPNLTPSVFAILISLKASVSVANINSLKQLYWSTLVLYPDDVLISLVISHMSDVLDTFLFMEFSSTNQLEQCNFFLSKLLKILPGDTKYTFVKDGLRVWFSRVMPWLISTIIEENVEFHTVDNCVELLELLVDALAHIEYAENPNWKKFLENIHNPQKYPTLLKNLLEKGNDVWHRVWIVLIKLLKNQITKVSNTSGSPINAMLPVVELAFKMDTTNRCRAFQCWNALIDNFCMETNEAFVIKRIKLLMIPLKLNNTKVEKTVLAKLNTWWHLLRSYHSRVDQFADIILLPFLHFCFGKLGGKPLMIPGQMTDGTKLQCIQTFVEIVGHVSCDGCVSVPKLQNKIVTTNLLIKYWDDWLYALCVAIRNAADNCTNSTKQQVSCIWKSFALTIAELPENNIRKDMLIAFLNLLDKLIKNNPQNYNFLGDIVFNVLIMSFFDENISLKHLLKTKGQDGPINLIISAIISPLLDNFCNSADSDEIASKFKIISDFIVDGVTCEPEPVINWLLPLLSSSCNTMTGLAANNALMLWASLAESTCESDNSCQNVFKSMLLWPLNHIKSLSEAKSCTVWYKWYTLYNFLCLKFDCANFDDDLLQILEKENSFGYFMLGSVLAITKRKISASESYEKETLLLVNAMNRLNYCPAVLPVLIDTLVLMINNIKETGNVTQAERVLKIVKSVLETTSQVDNTYANGNLVLIENFVESLHTLLEIEAFVVLKHILANDIILCPFRTKNQLKTKLLPLLNYILTKCKENEKQLQENIVKAIYSLKDSSENDKPNLKENTKRKQFVTPEIKVMAKKSKKKEPSIVNTVVENGEEYVVVKSHWKFNPRKLTENQKEKLKRKREDIPALYQDLSQSQDEFRLITWKTDSQDTSTSTSTKSASNSKSDSFVDVSSILKNMSNSDVVPKIMENFLADKKECEITNIEEFKNSPNSGVDKTSLQIKKDSAIPRMALKDRVCRNVRNLMEKSNLANLTVNNSIKTPESKPKSDIVNSAPPKICSDRPTRLIKKPKKFEDSELFALRKRRRSQNDSQPESNIADKNVIIEIKESGENHIKITPTEQQNDRYIKVTAVEDIKMSLSSTENTKENSGISKEKKETGNIEDINDKLKKKDQTQFANVNLLSNKIEPSKETLITKADNKAKETANQKSSVKNKTARIQKQLLIDMVEGHPLLQGQPEKRSSRKVFGNPAGKEIKRNLPEKNLEVKPDHNISNSRSNKKIKNRDLSDDEKSTSMKKEESQEKCQHYDSDDLPTSEDIIESSQDSTITTISVSSNKKLRKIPVVILEKQKDLDNSFSGNNTQSLLNDFGDDIMPLNNTPEQESREDIELPKNKTLLNERDLTENMDNKCQDKIIKPLEDKSSSEVITINAEEPVIVLDSEDTYLKSSTQEIAEADTQPLDDTCVESNTQKIAEADTELMDVEFQPIAKVKITAEMKNDHDPDFEKQSCNTQMMESEDDVTTTIAELSATDEPKSKRECSPLTNDIQRKKDFLNNTIEISPIKSLSPLRCKKSPSPETSGDYVIIQLSSPVQCNGEPFVEKCDSPEIFTEEKVSPDKRDQSPPRESLSVPNNSPSSSLSLKKNRPQMRNGRAAHMLGLCAPEKLQTIINNSDKSESEEFKRNGSTPARRNLRVLYNSVGESNESNTDVSNEENDQFLLFKRSLPTADCSPSGPILKRKLVEMADEATISPATKRKRVSFHDPPVSTTMAVQKYIEPTSLRSPQNSAHKRNERQMRAFSNAKSPKRLDDVFKLDSVLTKTVKSFDEVMTEATEDTQISSIEQTATPAVEIVKTSDLNDTEPICIELLDCNDPIDIIATELSSPAMKSLLIKELEGKVETVADLAKMTELEVNRLCIKAPKIKVAKKVLTDYNSKRISFMKEQTLVDVYEESPLSTTIESEKVNVEVQTNIKILKSCKVQTYAVHTAIAHVQTDRTPISNTCVQTDESGSKSTKDIVSSCLADREDFVGELYVQLEETSIRQISEKMTADMTMESLMKKMTSKNTMDIVKCVLDHALSGDERNSNLAHLQKYLCNRFDSKDLVLFCSQLLQKIHDKPA